MTGEGIAVVREGMQAHGDCVSNSDQDHLQRGPSKDPFGHRQPGGSSAQSSGLARPHMPTTKCLPSTSKS